MLKRPMLRFLPAVSIIALTVGVSGCAHRDQGAHADASIKDAPTEERSDWRFWNNWSNWDHRGDERSHVAAPPSGVHSFVDVPSIRFPSRGDDAGVGHAPMTRASAPERQPRAAAMMPARTARPSPRAVEPSMPKTAAAPVRTVPEVTAATPAPPPVTQTGPIVPVAPKVAAPAAPATEPAQAPAQSAGVAEPKVEFIPAPTMAAPQIINKPSAPTPPIVATPGAQTAQTAPAAQTAPPSTKVASLTEQTRVRSALDQADAFLKAGNAGKARALLQDAARGENGDLLTALGATYDPTVLIDYPLVKEPADPKRALELYAVAAGKGSAAAKERIAKLKVFVEKTAR